MKFFALVFSIAACSMVSAAPVRRNAPPSSQSCTVEFASTLSGQPNVNDVITSAVIAKFDQTAQQTMPITSSDIGVTSATPVDYYTTINSNAASGLQGSMVTGVVLKWSSSYLISNTNKPNTDSRGDFYVMDIACS